jgi:flagellar basal-body rod modification protein FlgD
MAVDDVSSYTGLWGAVPPKNSGTSAAKKADEVEVTRNPNSTLDKNAFLNLLVTQMKYQDPLNPTDDKQFLAQMAQFTALEQMQNMNATTSKSQAYSMIGKEIYAEKYNKETYTTEKIEGSVAAVTMKSGSPYLLVMTGESDTPVEVPLEDVVEVYDTSAAASADKMQSIYDSLSVSQNMALIGKTVQAVTEDANGNPIFVEGKVDSVKFFNGQAVLVVGDKQIFGKEVMSVGDEMQVIGSKVSVNKKDEVTGQYVSYIENGTVQGVKFGGKDNNEVYLVADGKEIRLDSLNEVIYLTEAGKYVGKQVAEGAVKGTVADVVIQDTKVQVKVLTGTDEEGAETYAYVEFSKVRGKA